MRCGSWQQFGLSCMAAVFIAACGGFNAFVAPSSGAGLAVADEKPADDKTADGEKAKESSSGDDAQKPEPVENPFPDRRFDAPSLDGGTEWLNTSGEITLKDLRGKVVVLDFWTYCCINCMHVLPDLKYLEKKYPNELVVIGVHSAKFDNEKDSENIRRAIQRYEIEHPVVNDSNMTIWRKFGTSSWPTLALIDPEGKFIGRQPGEGNRELFDAVIGKLVAYHRYKGTLDETPVRFDLERDKLKATPLKFPGKVLADEAGGRLFVSDSNHNRIVISTLAGELLEVVGTGAIGAQDGTYAEATFDHPQGMALVGDQLYVADTENHLLRQIDLSAKTVSTLAGTGEQARFRASGGKLLETALNSPWDLLEVEGILYIAMAGPHQMWSHKIGSEMVGVYAGSGREDIVDGPLNRAAMAQPSGIATDGQFLYVADSEGSSIRKIPVDPDGEMTTVVGTSNLPGGRALFEFGDVDGVGDEARLQHPLGVAYHDGTLYVADSYNQKIKRVDLKTRTATSWLGTGKAGRGLDPVQLSEPAGLAIAKGQLYIADTNNHRVCVADLKSGKVRELVIQGLEEPSPVAVADGGSRVKGPVEDVSVQAVAAGKALKFDVSFELPADFKLNKLAPVTYRVQAADGQKLIPADSLNAQMKASINGDAGATIDVPLTGMTGATMLELAVTYSYCREGVGGLCKLKVARWRIPVEFSADSEQTSIGLKAVADR